MRGLGQVIRREKAALGQQDGHVNLIVSCDLPEFLGNVVVLLLCQSIEFLLIVNGEHGDSALVLERCHRIAHGESDRIDGRRRVTILLERWGTSWARLHRRARH